MAMYVKLGVMLTETGLLTSLRDEIGDIVFEAFNAEFYMNILHNKSLNLYSSYYPLILKGILIQEKDAVPEINPINGKKAIFKYIVPNFNPTVYTYIDIYDYHFAINDTHDVYFPRIAQPNMSVATLLDQMTSLLPHVSSLYNVRFEFPHFVVVDPIPLRHMDFSVDMKCRKNLNQIDHGLHEMFSRLFVCDCKIAIKNRLPNLMNNNVFAGVEIENIISKWEDAENERKEIIEFFEADWGKDVSNMPVQAIYQTR